MLRSGLVSVTFRKLTPVEVLNLVSQAQLDGIEWGGDIHVPPGNNLMARQVGRQTTDAGVKVAAYGSYYRLGATNPVPFQAVLETAQELGAPVIRVWAGAKSSAEATAADWQSVVDDAHRIAARAATVGITISFEFHDHTLTDTPQTCVQLLRQIQAANIRAYWQPPVSAAPQECLDGLNMIMPWLSHVHVFHWAPGYTRCLLAEGQAGWLLYLDAIKNSAPEPGAERFLMLEFVRDDAPEVFYADASTLKEWIGHAQPV